jgi:hypothetical protein
MFSLYTFMYVINLVNPASAKGVAEKMVGLML